VQGGGWPVLNLLGGASALIGIDARPLVFAFAICGGAVAYFALPFEPALAHALGAAAGTFLLWLAARLWWTSDMAIMLSVIALGACLGLAAASLRARSVDAPVVRAETGPVLVEGWVQEVEPGRKGVRLLIKIHSVARMSDSEWPEYVRLTHTSRLEVAPGRFVRCWSVLRPPPGPSMPGEYDFRRQAWFAQLGAVGYVQGRCRGGALGAPSDFSGQAALWLGAVRRNLALEVNEAAGEKAGGFAAALVSGDRSFMSTEDSEALRAAGLFHIVSISGLHLSIVGGLVFLLVKRALIFIEPIALRIPAQKPAAIVAMIACLAYLVISGAAVETQRSFIMAAIVFGAIIFDRAAISLRTFAIALIAVVLLQPDSVVTPGFQMSFAATGALIAAFEIWRNKRSGKDAVLGPIAFSWVSIGVTSLAAGLATMPFAIYHFDRASPIGFVANLAATPIVTFLSAPSAALALILAPFGQADFGLRLFGYSLELLLWISHFFAQFEGSAGHSARAMPIGSMILATFALAAVISTTGAARFVFGGAFAAASLVVWSQAPRFVAHWSSSGELFYAEGDRQISRIEIADGGGLAPLRYDTATEATCAEQACQFAAENGTVIRVLKTAEPEVCLSLERRNEPSGFASCLDGGEANTIRWQWRDVAAQGGMTLYAKAGRLIEVSPAPCGKRPWYACEDQRHVR
jgi:competence protein ComEC